MTIEIITQTHGQDKLYYEMILETQTTMVTLNMNTVRMVPVMTASSSYCSLNNKQNEHAHRELENNETHTLMSTSENEITGTNIPLTDGSSDKS